MNGFLNKKTYLLSKLSSTSHNRLLFFLSLFVRMRWSLSQKETNHMKKKSKEKKEEDGKAGSSFFSSSLHISVNNNNNNNLTQIFF